MWKSVGAPLSIMAAAVLIAAPPAPVNAQLHLVSEKQELDAGRQADREIQQKYRVSRDSYLNGMVDHIGRRLVAVCERPNLDWTFRVLDSKELNAFSVPGYVYITTATLDAMRGDQDAVAGVLAHEIGHTCGKHAVHQMEKGTIGNLLIGLLGANNRTIGSLAGVATNLVMLGYSRGDENDADKRAVRYTVRAGYDPNGLVRFFRYLQDHGDKGGSGVATYFRTHPLTSDRIKRVQNMIAKVGDSADSGDRRYRSDRLDDRDDRDRDRDQDRRRRDRERWDDGG